MITSPDIIPIQGYDPTWWDRLYLMASPRIGGRGKGCLLSKKLREFQITHVVFIKVN